MTRAKIKETALHLFAEKGYEGTALSEIAGTVGIKTPSIYGHFPSKEQLLLEIWGDLLSEYRTLMEGLLEEVHGKNIEEQFLGLIRGYGQYFKERPETYFLWARMLMFPPPDFKERTIADCMAEETIILGRITDRLTSAVKRGEIKAAPVDDLLNAFIMLKEGYVQWLMFYSAEEADNQLRRLWPMLWHGFAK
ncbi:MAG: TetR/AcrR family transcriptional regulator [Deltaproteobacteria bacterium]